MADENSEDFFQKILKIFYDILKPAINMFSDDQARNELLGTLGVSGNGGSTSAPATGGLQAYIDKEDDEVDPFKLAGAIADLTSLIMGLEGIISAAVNASDEDEERTVGEIVTALLNLLTLDYIRRREPAFHAVLELLNTLDKNAVAAGGSANFLKDYIGGFFDKLGKGLDDTEGATSLSDSLFLVIAGGLFYLDHFLRSKGVRGLVISSNYGYEGVSSATTPIADAITNRALTFGVEVKPISGATGSDDVATVGGKAYGTMVFAPKDQGGIAFVSELSADVNGSFNFDENKHTIEYKLSGDGLFRIGTLPEARGGTNNKFLISYAYNAEKPKMIALLDKPAIKFAFGTAKLGLVVTPDDVLVKGILNIHYEFSKGDLSGFPFDLLPDDIKDKFPLGIGFSQKKGFFVDGDGNIGTGEKAGSKSLTPASRGPVEEIVAKLLNAFNKQMPVHLNLGNVVGIDMLTIAVKADPELKNFQLEVSIDFWLKLGSVITITISRLGMTLNAIKLDNNGGILGYDLQPGIKWPTGAGIRVNAGVVTGGGFLYLDPDKGEYFGALELSFKNLFDLKAVGILNTIMPDGSKGFSMLIIITAEFSPVQLGFGFTLIGVGGLLGINRRAEVEALRVGLKTNAIKSILFPEDVVGNINRIISDIKQIFPIQQDSFLIGLMGKIGWGTPTLISIELGIILQLPDPKIIILGVVKLALPTEETALVKIQVNFLGVIDFQNQFLYFEAVLFDSQLVGFPLTGSMALVVAWGDASTFGLSIGGFHPDFKDYPTVPTLPGAFREMDRISLQLLSGDNPRLGIECYFAVTSNSVQFGAKAELLAEGPMGFNLYGMLSLDVLFIFDPFSFSIRLEATLAIRHNKSVLFGIHFLGILSGPTPWHIEGEVSFGILFATITIGFETTWGDNKPEIAVETEDLRSLINSELSKAANWKPIIPDFNNVHVTLRTLLEDEQVDLLIHPFGAISFSQRALPLNFSIKKYGNKKPLHENESNFIITNVKIGGAALSFIKNEELFAVGNYQSLSEAEKLSRKSFERLESGVTINDTGNLALASTTLDPSELNYELDYTYDDNPLRLKKFVKLPSRNFKKMLRNAGAAESVLSWKNSKKNQLNAPVPTKVEGGKYTLASNDDLKEWDQNLRAGSYAEVLQSFDSLKKQKPEMAEKLQVVGLHELD
ncbi:DUF6603 domain-containing protein [Niabella ginsengisoli]|uniref:DUF6603 domain-containing protein n=1 Tax=Niabella ginsengisoli TaxID=522298 RepID=A0ABS9SRI2_9BACT|nr:DUF6603 domain-containing protein [Niabella ginsengisoli]MCH5600861.1 hypothetical protein [Niabella ginsengisoli]